jgi:outer membrane protein
MVKKSFNLILSLTCWLGLFSFTGQSFAVELLTRAQAYEAMKNGSFKAKEIGLLDNEGQAAVDLASSQFYPLFTLEAREFGGRLNPIQFGLNDTSSVSWFTAGQTAVQIVVSIYNQANHDRAKAAEWYQKKNFTKRDQYYNDLTFFMLSQFLSVQRLRSKILVQQSGIERAEKIKTIAEARVGSGYGVKLDMLHAQTLLEYEKIKELELQTAYDKAIHLLAITLGRESLEQELEPLEMVDFHTPDDSKQVIESQVQNRPDIQSSFNLIKINESLTSAISHERLPKVSFLGDIGMLGATTPLGLGRDINGSVGIQISAPIFNLSIGAREDQSKASTAKAELEAEEATFEARSEVRQAIKQIIQAKKTIELSNHQLAAAEEEIKISSEKYSAGSMSGFEYSTVRNMYMEAKNSNIDAIYAFELSKAYYFKTISQYEAYFKIEANKKVKT